MDNGFRPEKFRDEDKYGEKEFDQVEDPPILMLGKKYIANAMCTLDQ